MFRFFNKNSASFIASFLLFILVSLSVLIGISAYADANSFSLTGAVINFFSPKK